MVRLSFNLTDIGHEELNVSMSSLFDERCIDIITNLSTMVDDLDSKNKSVNYSTATINIFGNLGSGNYSGHVLFEAFEDKMHHISFVKKGSDVYYSQIIRGDNPLSAISLINDINS